MQIKVFTLPSCAPCKVLKETTQDANLPIEFIEIDMDDQEILDQLIQFNIRTAPTVIFVDNYGKELYKTTKIVNLEQLTTAMEEFM